MYFPLFHIFYLKIVSLSIIFFNFTKKNNSINKFNETLDKISKKNKLAIGLDYTIKIIFFTEVV